MCLPWCSASLLSLAALFIVGSSLPGAAAVRQSGAFAPNRRPSERRLEDLGDDDHNEPALDDDDEVPEAAIVCAFERRRELGLDSGEAAENLENLADEEGGADAAADLENFAFRTPPEAGSIWETPEGDARYKIIETSGGVMAFLGDWVMTKICGRESEKHFRVVERDDQGAPTKLKGGTTELLPCVDDDFDGDFDGEGDGGATSCVC